MQFIDEARFVVRGGRGGDGSVSFNREKYKPRGGPDGGRGGDGGSVVFRASEDTTTLENLAYRSEIHAAKGRHGSGNNRAGERGESVTFEVPVGTLIFDSDGLLADLAEHGDECVAAKGGEGGRGNSSFATSTRQTPKFRERGLPGEEREIRLELRILSDIGLVGLPNAGKSSLLTALSAARPKVGDYPFTTLIPKLGVVDERGMASPFVVADIPGLISGASEGRGLGNRFLRHIARARVLVILLDASENPEGAEGTLRAELHAARLSEKPVIVALNKVDLLDEELREYLTEAFPGALQVSAVTGEGLPQLRDAMSGELHSSVGLPVESAVGEHRVYRPEWRGLRVEEAGDEFLVTGEEIGKLALKTDWDSPEGVEYFQRELERRGVVAALRRAGAETGDEVRVGEIVFDFK